MSPDSSKDSLLCMSGISKSFGPTQALTEVDFDLNAGEVHALLGENGAGKSTLVKVLSGAVTPDRGTVFLGADRFIPSGPLDSRKHGISMIYQELNLAPHLTVEQNIMLGREIQSGGFIRQGETRRKVSRVLEVIQHPEISPESLVSRLSIGARQIVEIARALVEEAKILIMDEPTSSLSHEDSERLFSIIHGLKNQGVGIIYISHFLEEVQRVADRMTILRDGAKVHSGPMGGIALDEIIQMMVGRAVTEMFPRIPHSRGEETLQLKSLRGRRMKSRVGFKLSSGEILGVAGLVGAGRTETLRTIFGLDRISEGEVIVFGAPFSRCTPWKSIRLGMGYLSEDRQGEGLAMGLSIAENISLSDYSPYLSRGMLNLKKRKQTALNHMESMNVKARGPSQKVRDLSGGNQQKVALARLVHQKARIYLLDEPTRGIDVVSKSQIYEWMGKKAAEGKAVVFVSSYLPELLGISDRIAVFHRGRLVENRPVGEWSQESILAAATVGSIEAEDEGAALR